MRAQLPAAHPCSQASVLRLRPCDTATGKPLPGPFADVFLEPNSLYVMKDTARYRCTHEILAQADMPLDWKVAGGAERSRRISLIFRDAVEPP